MKARHIMLNGSFLPAENPCIMPGNRGLLFGEVVWQSMRGCSSKVFFFDTYFDHLCEELDKKDIQRPSLFTSKIIEHDIFLLLQKCRIYTGALIRITVFRNANNDYFYYPDVPVSVLIEAESHIDQHYTLSETGLKMAAFEEVLFPSVIPNFTSTLQGLGFAGMQKHFSSYHVDNLFLVNDDGNIFQTPDANVMFIKDNDLFIPSERYLYSTDVLCGYVENAAEKIGLSVSRDSEIQPRDLLNFDEVLLIDSIHGIRWVQAFGEKRFYNRVATKLTSALCDLA
ncbi:MAG TPA: aminotransferase class IV [Bacteroidales bacterium]|nr:aminotransferase class IV [Bacteroidales bacterium]